MPEQLCHLFYRERLHAAIGLLHAVDQPRRKCMSERVQTFMLHPDGIEYSIEPIAHIAWVREVAVLVRYQRSILTEIHFLAQVLYHFYRSIIERHISFTRLAFQLSDLDFELRNVLQAIADVYFFYTTL